MLAGSVEPHSPTWRQYGLVLHSAKFGLREGFLRLRTFSLRGYSGAKLDAHALQRLVLIAMDFALAIGIGVPLPLDPVEPPGRSCNQSGANFLA